MFFKRGIHLAFIVLTLGSVVLTIESEVFAQDAAAIIENNSPAFNLERCIEIALEKNFDILNAKDEIARQEGVYLETRAKLFPHVSFVVTFDQIAEQRIATFNNQVFGSEYTWAADAVVTQELFTGGRNSALREREQYRIDAARFALESVIYRVLLQVRERYYQVLLSREQIDVQEQTVQLLEEELRSETSKRDAGTVSNFNVLRSEVSLANSKTPLIRARNEYRIALAELSRVLGLESSAPKNSSEEALTVTGELRYLPLELELEQALTRALRDRPELKRLNLLVEAEERGVSAARSGYFPQLSGFVQYGTQKSPFASDFLEENHGWEVGLQSDWSIFDSFETEGRVKQAQANYLRAQHAQEQTRVEVTVEVRRAISTFVEAKELVLASKKVVEQAEESLRLARARNDVGSGIQLDVLQTQVALTDARTNEIRALHDYNVALARVLQAVGAQDLSQLSG